MIAVFMGPSITCHKEECSDRVERPDALALPPGEARDRAGCLDCDSLAAYWLSLAWSVD